MQLVSNDIPHCIAFALEFLLGCEASRESSSENEEASATEELQTAMRNILHKPKATQAA